MDGFVMQQTDFPFICCIVDDASTDGEQDVIKGYLKDHFDYSVESCHFDRETDYALITYARHKKNKNCHFVVLYLKENTYSEKIRYKKIHYIAEWDTGKYLAICEGDDYWTNPDKLQNQVDFLDRHPQYSMCCHNAMMLTPSGFKDMSLPTGDKDISTCLAFVEWNFPTASFLIRHELISNEFQSFTQNAPVGDGPLLINSAIHGKIRYMKETMSVYRFECNGSWNERMKKNPEKMLQYRQRMVQWLRYADNYTHHSYHKYFEYLAQLQEARIDKAKGKTILLSLVRLKLWIQLHFSLGDIRTVLRQLT